MADELHHSNFTLQEKLDELTRELQECLAQQTATGEILRVIAGAPAELQAGIRHGCGKCRSGMWRQRRGYFSYQRRRALARSRVWITYHVDHWRGRSAR